MPSDYDEPIHMEVTESSWHEVMDRTHLAIAFIADHLIEHHAVVGTGYVERIDRAVDILAELYAEFGEEMARASEAGQ